MKTTIIKSLVIATAASFLGFSSSAQAAMFGTRGISFEQDTTVNFQFLKSQGKAISTFGVASSTGQVLATLFREKGEASVGYGNELANGNPNKWFGGADNLLGAPTASFTFLANQVYSLFVGGTLNGQTLTNKFSTSALNVAGEQHAVFDSTGAKEGQYYGIAANKQDGLPTLEYGTAIGMEDLKSSGDLWTRDSDYNDFVVRAEVVPEPLTMTGLALGIGGMVAARRRRNENKA
jgi:hypothetical protein